MGAAQSSRSLSSGLLSSFVLLSGCTLAVVYQDSVGAESMFSLPFPFYWSQAFPGLLTTLTCWTSVFRGQSVGNLRALSAVTADSAKPIPLNIV